MPPKSAVFTATEHRSRFARARAALRRAKLDACLMVAPENLFYFAGYETWVSANSPQFFIFTAGDDPPTLVLRNVDLALARESSWVEDVRTYHLHGDDLPGLVCEILAEKDVHRGRIAIEVQSFALPYALGRALDSALADTELVDATELLGDLRLIKSPAEIAMLDRAGKYAGIGLEAARSALMPGMTEIALAAEIEAAMRRAGSDYWAIPTELASGWRTPGGHAAPRPKVIEPGNLVHVEFAGVCNRYHATALQTMSVGDPGPRARDLYAIALESLRAGMAQVRPGTPVDAVEEASLAPLRRAGLESAAMMRFGYGIGIAYPPIWLETLQISRGFDQRLEPGMVFVLHSCLELPDEDLGVIQGGTYLLEPGGMRMLAGAGDVDLLTI